MTQEQLQRIDAIKAECAKILRLEKAIVPNQWSVVPGRGNGLYDSMVVSGGSDPTFVIDGYRDDCVFIAHARNVSPAMARVALFAIEQFEIGANNGDFSDKCSLESIADQWEGKP